MERQTTGGSLPDAMSERKEAELKSFSSMAIMSQPLLPIEIALLGMVQGKGGAVGARNDSPRVHLHIGQRQVVDIERRPSGGVERGPASGRGGSGARLCFHRVLPLVVSKVIL